MTGGLTAQGSQGPGARLPVTRGYDCRGSCSARCCLSPSESGRHDEEVLHDIECSPTGRTL
jgi:hypothetical protein